MFIYDAVIERKDGKLQDAYIAWLRTPEEIKAYEDERYDDLFVGDEYMDQDIFFYCIGDNEKPCEGISFCSSKVDPDWWAIKELTFLDAIRMKRKGDSTTVGDVRKVLNREDGNAVVTNIGAMSGGDCNYVFHLSNGREVKV